jgi:hypothetical protein
VFRSCDSRAFPFGGNVKPAVKSARNASLLHTRSGSEQQPFRPCFRVRVFFKRPERFLCRDSFPSPRERRGNGAFRAAARFVRRQRDVPGFQGIVRDFINAVLAVLSQALQFS